MHPLDLTLTEELARREEAGLRRRLDGVVAGAPRAREFTSNDYLGLASHPLVIEAAVRAAREHGAGGRASRLLGGGSPLERTVEREVAGWLGAEDALYFSTGYMANLGVVTALAGRGDTLLCDEHNHASLIDAARLSRATVAVVRHRDLDELADRLARARGARRRIVLTDSVFSMDGDLAPLAAIAELCVAHDAWLIVDEAHAVGLLGSARAPGAGAWAAAGVEGAAAERLVARVVTGGKALGSCGALVVSSRGVRERLVNHARSLIYTTAPPPAAVGALDAALRLAREDTGPAERALDVARGVAAALGLAAPAAAIVPFVVGTSADALAAARRLAAHDLEVRAVRPPTVPEGTARLRIACHAYNDDAAVRDLVDGLARETMAPGRTTGRDARAEPGAGAHDEHRDAPGHASARRSPPLVVVGTDTGVGKTVVAALLARAAARALGGVAYWKPVQTGTESDTEHVRALCAGTAVCCEAPAHAFALPASPHEAAAAEGRAVDVDALAGALEALARRGPAVVELAGGLFVPYDDDRTQADLVAGAGELTLALVARSGLGTLNHTLLTLEALAARHRRPVALFLVGEPHPSNRRTLAARGGVAHVHELPPLEPLDAAALDAWLDRVDLSPLFARWTDAR